MTPLGAVIKGLIAGTIGTAIFDLFWYGRYRKGGGEQKLTDWEFSAGLDDWEKAGAPAQVGKRMYEGMLQRELKSEKAALTNNVVHWGNGIAWGAGYGLLAGSTKRRSVVAGLPFGAGVWAFGYAALAPMGLYKPMWEYDTKTLWKDLSAHLVYGVATAGAFRLLDRRARGSDTEED